VTHVRVAIKKMTTMNPKSSIGSLDINFLAPEVQNNFAELANAQKKENLEMSEVELGTMSKS